MLIVAAIDVTNGSITVDHQRGRMRDIQGIHPNQVIQPITLGNHSVLVEKKRKTDRVLLQELGRLKHPIPLFGGDVGQFRTRLGDLVLDRLDPSRALDAIRSPRPPQKLGDQNPAPQKTRQSQHALAVGGFERKLRSPRPNLQGFGVVEHL